MNSNILADFVEERKKTQCKNLSKTIVLNEDLSSNKRLRIETMFQENESPLTKNKLKENQVSYFDSLLTTVSQISLACEVSSMVTISYGSNINNSISNILSPTQLHATISLII